MTAWRMYRRTLDEESAALWRAEGVGTETAVLANWIRREARREGLAVHPTATVSINRLYEGDEPIGVCVSIPVEADPDPRYVQPLDTDLPSMFDDHGSGPPVLGVAIVLVLFVVLVVAYLLVAIADAWRAFA